MKNKKYLTMLCGLALMLAAQNIFGFSTYVSRIPNGATFSCVTCHGPSGPPLNGFGSAFLSGGTVWNASLAGRDSDGDGATNGRELGDPAGTWVAGAPNPPGPVTNPGDPASKPPSAVAPTITTQPRSLSVTAGANVAFWVVATGTAPLSYQWQKDGANLASATTSSLSLSNVASANAGSYRVQVSNTAGSVTSAAATLTVNPAVVAPRITTQPLSQTVVAGANVSFSVVATGTAPLGYQWQKDGANLAGATASSLALNNVTSANAGSYRVQVSNTAGSVMSAAATLAVNPAVAAPSIATQPASQTVTAGANVSFSVVATGTAPLSYQWQKDGANLTGATASRLALSSVTSANAGSYRVQVSNTAGSVMSAAATLTVNAAPSLGIALTSPTNGAVYAAPANVPLAAAVTGANIDTVAFFDGTNLVGYLTAAPYTLIASNLPAGEHRFTATVIDTAGASSASEVVSVMVVDQPPPSNLPPTVRIVAPEDGTTLSAPARLVLAASAADSDGGIARVEFFIGSESLGIGTLVRDEEAGEEHAAEGTIYLGNRVRVPAGVYTITARATDNLGAVTTSAPVKIVVRRAPRRN